MKRLIILQLCLIFFAASFKGDTPPSGWYIQQIPVNKQISDIYFIDTLNGWAVTQRAVPNDTSYILKTTNGGINWDVNYVVLGNISLFSIQFTDLNTGYTCGSTGGGTGKLYKTTNNGLNWNLLLSDGNMFTDLWFINKDTGWVADNGAVPFGIGLLKTTNGGINWTVQMSNAYMPEKLFFLNKDTGWVVSDGGELYRTNNSGNTFTQVFDFFTPSVMGIHFTTTDTGWAVRWGTTEQFLKTINGGLNWQIQTDPDTNNSIPMNLYMINSKLGYITTLYSKIIKTSNGIDWRKQNAPNGPYNIVYFTDSIHGWASHYQNSNIDIAATSDGGGPVMQTANNNELITKEYRLYQNYPNPFNPTTSIRYSISSNINRQSSMVKLVVYNIQGKEIATLVNEKQKAGEYEVKFDGSNLSSGIYFYSLYADGKITDTKKMILLK